MTPGKKVSKWVDTRQDPNKPWYESSGLRPREGSTQSKSRTKCAKRCGWSSGHFWTSPTSKLFSKRSTGTEIPFRSTWHHPRTSAGNEIVAVFVTRVECLQHVEEDLNEHGLQKDALIP